MSKLPLQIPGMFGNVCHESRVDLLFTGVSSVWSLRPFPLADWTIPLKEAASLLWNFLPLSFAALTLLSLIVLNQKS